MAIKAILWDLGDVIVPVPCSWPQIVEGVVNGLEGAGGLARTWFEIGGGEGLLHKAEIGLATHEQFWQEASIAGGVSRLDIAMASSLFSWYIRPFPEIVSLLCKLQKQYILIAVSDGDFGSKFVVRSLYAHHGFSFKEVFISSEFRVKKPLLFGYVVSLLREKFSIQPEECVFVDNKAENVMAANRLGMSAFVFNITQGNTPEYLTECLRNVGVNTE